MSNSNSKRGDFCIKLDPRGGRQGNAWDDGNHHEVRAIVLSYDDGYISSIQVVYGNDDGTSLVSPKHGGNGRHTQVIEITSPITRIDGCYGQYTKHHNVVRSLAFSGGGAVGCFHDPVGGLAVCTSFSFKYDNGGFTGFHGRSDDYFVNAIGVHASNTASRP